MVTRPHLPYNLSNVIKFCRWRHEHNLWRHNLCFRNTFILRTIRVAFFGDIINKDSKKVKKIKIYVSKWNLYLYFLIHQNLLISGEKMLMSAELKGRVKEPFCLPSPHPWVVPKSPILNRIKRVIPKCSQVLTSK